MTKDQLKTGYVVQRRNGSYSLVMKDSFEGDTFVNVDNDFCLMCFDDYTSDLLYNKSETQWDIMKVFTVDTLTDILRYLVSKQYDKLTLLWERKSPKEQQLKWFVEKLQSQLKEAQEELKKLEAN